MDSSQIGVQLSLLFLSDYSFKETVATKVLAPLHDKPLKTCAVCPAISKSNSSMTFM